MNNPYQALLNFLASRGVTKEVFEATLQIPLDTFIHKLNECISHDYTWQKWWDKPMHLFRFANTPQGPEYWVRVFDIPDTSSITDVLTPFEGVPLTKEQIFIQFLKHYRLFAAFKRNYASDSEDVYTIAPAIDIIDRAFRWEESPQGHELWGDLNLKWRKLCKQFKLTGDISYADLFRKR